MATTSSTTANLQGTTAGLVALATALFGLFSSAGWVQTSDTGQTANASFVGPGVANTAAGYQIWRMNDALQVSGSTVYVKVELGTAGQTTASAIWITLGTGSDGSGNITGVLAARTQSDTTLSSYSTTASLYYGSGASNRIAWTQNSTTCHTMFSIERTKDASGNDTNDGLLYFLSGNTAVNTGLKFFQYVRFTNNTLVNSSTIGAWCPSGATWADAAGTNNIGVCPLRFFNGQPSNPCLAWQAYMNGDQAAGQQITVQIYSANHTYITLGTGIRSTVASSNANSTLMMLFE